jgi:hypothetical protein
VIITHNSTEGSTRGAVEEIDKLASVRQGSVRMRIRE